MKSNMILISEENFYEFLDHVIKHVYSQKGEAVPEDVWINEDQAKKILGVQSSQMYRLRSKGLIRYSKPSRKVLLYDKSSILEYIEKNAKDTF